MRRLPERQIVIFVRRKQLIRTIAVRHAGQIRNENQCAKRDRLSLCTALCRPSMIVLVAQIPVHLFFFVFFFFFSVPNFFFILLSRYRVAMLRLTRARV